MSTDLTTESSIYLRNNSCRPYFIVIQIWVGIIFDSNRTNTVILKFEAIKVMRWLVVAIPSISYGILKMVKLGIKRWKAKLWLKLWLKIPKRILLTRFNINFITNKQLKIINNEITS